MALPPLNKLGLLPQGVHQGTLCHIATQFARSPYRIDLFSSVKCFIDTELKSACSGLTLVMGGSFFSDKELPNDIEMTVQLPLDYPKLAQAIELCSDRDRLKEQYKVDFYPSIKGQNDFVGFFQYVGPKTGLTKGIDEKTLRGVVEVVQWELG